MTILESSNVNKLAKHQQEQFSKWEALVDKEKMLSTSQQLTGYKVFCLSNLATHFSRQLRITFLAQLPYFLCSPLFLIIFFSLLCTIFDLEMTTADACYPLEGSENNMSTCNSEKRQKEEDLFNQNTHYLSCLVLMVSLISILSSTLLYIRSLTIFEAEHRNRWCSLGVFVASTSAVNLVEVFLTSVFIAAFSYLISGQHTIDASFNWTRFALFVLFILLMAVYSQAIGHLLGALLSKFSVVAVLISCDLAMTFFSFLNGLYIKLERMGSGQAMVALEDVVGFAGLSRGLLYAIYGFERCDFDSQYYSWVLVEYKVDEERLVESVWKALLNVALLKVLTLIVLWWRFSQRQKNHQKTFKKEVDCLFELEKHQLRSSFTLETTIEMNGIAKVDKSRDSKILSEKMNCKNEQTVLAYSKAKVILAWHNLSLLQRSSFFFDSTLQNENPLKFHKQKEPLLILRHLDGAIRFNSLTALMGVSGSVSFLVFLCG